jgi:hypothetical protein
MYIHSPNKHYSQFHVSYYMLNNVTEVLQWHFEAQAFKILQHLSSLDNK